MKSPFPGMDPFLELHWRDAHHRFCTYACDEIQPQIRPQLLARVDERLVVETDNPRTHDRYPDVKIATDPRSPFSTDGARGGGVAVLAAIDEPIIIEVPADKPMQGFINIIDPQAGGKLVTVIEFLSPSNKRPGRDRDAYTAKQQELIESGVNLIEIDLVRAGIWTVAVEQDRIPQGQLTPYCVLVHRATASWKPEYYPIAYNERLPTFGVPLRAKDKDAVLPLQKVFEKVYANGAYDSTDYTQRLDPPLEPEVQRWVNKILRKAKGKRR